MRLVFATNNANKVQEIQSLVGADFKIIPLTEAGIDIDIPEPHDSFQDNAFEKATTIFKITNQNCFSEDTGLEIESTQPLFEVTRSVAFIDPAEVYAYLGLIFID